jgi:hypothetical protein
VTTEPELSDDELTILAIAAEGESMIPLGKWEKAVERLVSLGYLRRLDKFNNVITARGKARAAAQEDADAVAFINLNNLVVRRKEEEAGDAPGDAERS